MMVMLYRSGKEKGGRDIERRQEGDDREVEKETEGERGERKTAHPNVVRSCN